MKRTNNSCVTGQWKRKCLAFSGLLGPKTFHIRGNIVPHQAEDEWLLLLREGHWCCSHASIQGESKQRKFLSEKMLFDRFTLSSTWTRAASMCASPSLTPTISINATCFNWYSFYFIKTDAKYVSKLWLNLFCRSAAKNYFIKYGELGALNCAAERVSNTSYWINVLCIHIREGCTKKIRKSVVFCQTPLTNFNVGQHVNKGFKALKTGNHL